MKDILTRIYILLSCIFAMWYDEIQNFLGEKIMRYIDMLIIISGSIIIGFIIGSDLKC